MSELAPCPTCFKTSDIWTNDAAPQSGYVVFCKTCGEDTDAKLEAYGVTVEAAHEQWNELVVGCIDFNCYDHEIPEPLKTWLATRQKRDTMRVGGMALPLYQSRHWLRELKTQWGRADLSLVLSEANDVLPESWHALLECFHVHVGYVRVETMGSNAEEAVAKARALGNFPPEFFEALSKEIEEL